MCDSTEILIHWQAGRPLRQIARSLCRRPLRLMLGHATLGVTQTYMHLAEAHVKVRHHRFSPVDRLRIKSKRTRQQCPIGQ